MNVKPSATHECGVWGKKHPTDRCFKLLHCDGSECRERVQRAGLCYRCLRKGHIAKGCSSLCSKCNGRHHKLLCGVQSLSAGSSPNVKSINQHVSMASVEISRTVESLPSVKPSASNATETTSKEHVCCYKLPELKCEGLEGSPKPPFFLILGLIDLMLPVN